MVFQCFLQFKIVVTCVLLFTLFHQKFSGSQKVFNCSIKHSLPLPHQIFEQITNLYNFFFAKKKWKNAATTNFKFFSTFLFLKCEKIVRCDIMFRFAFDLNFFFWKKNALKLISLNFCLYKKKKTEKCVCASLKMCFTIDSLAIYLQTFIDLNANSTNLHSASQCVSVNGERFPAL